MSDRLPPLTALRAFESAARHLSFAKAAEELNVTPAALSFQIKNLEDHLGTPLFHRLNRAVTLTEAGQTLAPGTSEGFDQLTTAWRATRRLQNGQALTVTAGPAFTAKWLAPRLYGFAQAHPDIELRFAASLGFTDLARDGVDVAIRYGLPRDDGLYSEPLMDDAILPAARPDVAARFPSPESLLTAPLIYDDSIHFMNPVPDWQMWLRASGVDGPLPDPAARFSGADHALDAALAGGGVVLTRSSILRLYLPDKRLVAPYPVALGTEAHFRFVCLPGAETRPQVRVFRDWIFNEVQGWPSGVEGKTLVPVSDVP